MGDHYEALGLDRQATRKDIKSAFLKLARKHHPDVVQESHRAAAELKFKKINAAYQVLGDTIKRRDYDSSGFRSPGGYENAGYRAGRPEWAKHDPAWNHPRYSHNMRRPPLSAYFTSKGAMTLIAITVPVVFVCSLISGTIDSVWAVANDGKKLKFVQEDVAKRSEQRSSRSGGW